MQLPTVIVTSDDIDGPYIINESDLDLEKHTLYVESGEVDEDPTELQLEDMTKEQLIEVAEKYEAEFNARMTKAEIIEAIRAAAGYSAVVNDES